MKFEITDYHLPYLFIQCGDIWHLVEGPLEEWKKAYEERIEKVFESMRPALPAECRSILDVGGGLSGIGARLNQHYGGGVLVAVLDGKVAPPRMEWHAKPFNNATVTQNFLRLNGVRQQMFFSPIDELTGRYDLVISTQAWGFHFGPDMYANRIRRTLRDETVAIIDVRAQKPEYRQKFQNLFGPEMKALAKAPKWTRYAFSRPPVREKLLYEMLA